MARKRSRDDFENDESTARYSMTADEVSSTSKPEEIARGNDGVLEGEEWQIPPAAKKKQKKIEKKIKKAEAEAQRQHQKAEEEARLGPLLRFDPQRVNASLRIKDLQNLVLYILADGVAPVWVAVRNRQQIRQVVVLMVPGMDSGVLKAATAKMITWLDDSPSKHPTEDKPHGNEGQEMQGTTPGSATPVEDDKQVISPMRKASLIQSIVPVKAPGDSKTSRIYSPLQNMLISPDPETKKNNGQGTADIFQVVQTPLHNFIHTAEQLVEAEFPVHPALFTDSSDAQIEKRRRESAGQSTADGWVDTLVDSSIPRFPEHASGTQSPVTLGLTVYALDCEMVLTNDDKYSLARISILDWLGKVVLDQLVVPELPIKNYYTQFSGITEEKLKGVTTRLSDVQARLLNLFTPSTVLIGHSLESDLNAMKTTHPYIVDTSLIYPHPRGLPFRSALRFLSNKYLKREIQKAGADGHDSVEDARAVLDLVRLKCEKGPTYGTMDANGESIFSRLGRAGHTTAILESGTLERGLGRHATIKVSCGNDEETVSELIKITTSDSMTEHSKHSPVAFTWGRLRDLEVARGWNSNSNRYATANANDANPTGCANGDNGNANEKTTNSSPEEEIATAGRNTVDRLARIYNSLAASTLFVVFPGPGDMREVLRLHEMQRQYRKEFKVKKWDELSVQWTDTEEQALKKAFNKARHGNALVCLK